MLVRTLLVCAVGGLAAWLLSVSWMRWMDPLIDFGRELYLPWRIAHGEHPGRDFIHPYGPLSVYFNAGLFALCGESIRALVIANLAIFAGIVCCLHRVLRRAFGFVGAAVGTMLGVAVFGFPHYWGINNYTYAAPYSHEATHGMALLLLLLVWLGRPAARASRADGFVAGVCVGLCCLTKTEYVFASLVVAALASVRIRIDGRLRPGAGRWFAGASAGLVAVFAVAWGALSLALPPADAARVVVNAIAAPLVYADYSRSAHVLRFLGADNLAANLRSVFSWGGIALLVLLALTLVARKIAPGARRGVAAVFLAALAAGVAFAVPKVPWVFVGTAFPVLLGAAGVFLTLRLVRAWRRRGRLPLPPWNQFVLLFAAGAMLARMAFDPTISHYGFFQALLAGTWLSGFLVAEWPKVAASHRWLRGGLAVAVVGLLGGGTVTLIRTSLQFYRLKQTPIGEGADRIRAYGPQAYPLPEYWEQARRHLLAHTPPDSSLLVVPEGISLNYWTRRKHPLRIMDLLPATLRLNRGSVVDELAARPPDTIVIVSRPNPEELGFRVYGEDESSGKALVDWVARNYVVAAQAGNPPLSPGGVGLQILRRRPSAAAP